MWRGRVHLHNGSEQTKSKTWSTRSGELQSLFLNAGWALRDQRKSASRTVAAPRKRIRILGHIKLLAPFSGRGTSLNVNPTRKLSHLIRGASASKCHDVTVIGSSWMKSCKYPIF